MVKRVVLLVLAAILLLVAAALGAAAAWGYSALGADGVMRFGLGTITPDPNARATIIDVDRYSLSVPYIQSMGTVTLEATTGEAGDPSDVLFLGAAATADVDAYLKGTPYSVAVRVGDEWQTRPVPGAATAASPREQSFWLAASVGREPAIQVPEQRPLTLVITHPAGLATGPFELRFGFTVPDAPTWILVMAVAAGVLLLIAIVLVIVAFRVKTGPKRRGKHEAELVSDPVDVAPAVVAAPVLSADDDPIAGTEPAVEAEVAGTDAVEPGAQEPVEAAVPTVEMAAIEPTEEVEIVESAVADEPQPTGDESESAEEDESEPDDEVTPGDASLI